MLLRAEAPKLRCQLKNRTEQRVWWEKCIPSIHASAQGHLIDTIRSGGISSLTAMKQYVIIRRSTDDNRSIFRLINTSAAKQRVGPVTEQSSEPSSVIAPGCSTICTVFLVQRKFRLVLGNEDTAWKKKEEEKENKGPGSGLSRGMSTETFILSHLC